MNNHEEKILCSIGILTFNNGTSLHECLESVKQFDDIVICDGGSTDSTIAIAKEHGCKIVNQDQRFKNSQNRITDFSGVRNQQLAVAKYDWFMFLDSDEYVSLELVEEVREIVEKNPTNPAIFEVPRKYIKDGRIIDCATTYPNYQTRFFNKKAVKQFVRTVHERIEPKEGYMTAKLKKYEYVPLEDVWSMKKKWATYLAIEEQKEGRERFSTWFVSGLLYHTAVSLLYCWRYIKILIFCRGNRMPILYEAIRLWYNFEVIKIGFRRVLKGPLKSVGK